MFDEMPQQEEVLHLDLDDQAFLPDENHDPKIAELEAMLAEADRSAKKIDKAMKTHNSALEAIKFELDKLADKIETAEYFYHDDQGNVVPGVKAIEFDLARTQDPEKIRYLEKQLAAAKARMARFAALYENFSDSNRPRREKLQEHIAQLDLHLIALSHQRKMTKKQLDEYIASKNTPKNNDADEELEDISFLTTEQQQDLITAIETHLRVSPVEPYAIIDLRPTLQLKNSIMRYKINPKKELAVVGKAIEFTESNLGEGEIELLYETLSHRDSSISN
ncbi:hypothetical protein KBD61_00520 [Patescibacteria group bacterium]|nr:hypothetical protein [Patescibacteria group bacterium]MBP9709490.1 hypothetical protein [Patescibacteria group bacterium]